MGGRWVASIAVTAVTVAAAGTASAASWQLQPAANPAQSTQTALAGVSCLSVACTAVGWSWEPLNGEQTLAERGQGGSWTIQRTPNPAGVSGGGGDFSAVSCPAQRRCEAIGNTDDTIGNDVFIAGWNGTRWSMQGVPVPSDDDHDLQNPPSDFLGGVSCVRTNLCVAVGSYQSVRGPTFPLTERWNGKAWKVLPKAKGSAGKQLNAVSCTGAGACMAVGGTIAERWNGRAWTIQSTARLGGGRPANLAGIACASARRCIAVGAYTRGARLPLAELWNGQKWSVLPTPGSGTLAAVSCPSAGVCFAVGVTSSHAALIEGWNGTAWTIQPTAYAASTKSALRAVSCAGPTACTAVGASGNGPLAMAYS